ncbi:MAG: dihydrolipoamide acetyltransferase family protein [Chloroflexota bacterium]|nr:dihydrolipoamide acetyltransferase family protein [Chloroflexota bacterium]
MAEIVTMPKLGFDMVEGTLAKWVILEGEQVAKGATMAEIETDKATVEVESVYDGIIAKHLVPEGEVVPVNTPIAVVAAVGEEVDLEGLMAEMTVEGAVEPPPEAEETPESVLESAAVVSPDGAAQLPGGVKASPLARRMAQDMGIDLRAVQGTGSGGRVIKKDIETYLSAPAGIETPVTRIEPPPPAKVPLSPLMAVEIGAPREDVIVPLRRLRAAIGRRMTEVKQTVPHFYVTHEYDMAAVMALRKSVNEMIPEGEKLSVNDFIVKATALTLQQYPNLNASLQGDSVLHHGQINVAVAVAVEGGLLTVVNHNTDRMSIRQISVNVREMVMRAREGKVKPGDIEGSTFSVSNMGMYDVEHFIAIINPPEAAILAVGSVQDVPVVDEGAIVPGKRMKATLSVDHRVSDGAEAARFLQTLAEYLEDPLKLLL